MLGVSVQQHSVVFLTSYHVLIPSVEATSLGRTSEHEHSRSNEAADHVRLQNVIQQFEVGIPSLWGRMG